MGRAPDDLNDEAWRCAVNWLSHHGTSRRGYTHADCVALATMIDFRMRYEAERVAAWMLGIVALGTWAKERG